MKKPKKPSPDILERINASFKGLKVKISKDNTTITFSKKFNTKALRFGSRYKMPERAFIRRQYKLRQPKED